MKYHTIKLYLIIFVLALVLRTVSLGSLPYGFHVDEAKAAWNAYSILKTSRDDQGHLLPLYYNSFGDFRPTGIIYLIIPFLLFFANSVTATRLPAAILGALCVVPIMLIFGEITKGRDKKWYWVVGILLAINPWQMMVSRATSEVVASMFLALAAIYFFIKVIKSQKNVSVFWVLFFVATSYFFYHSVRILEPIFFIIIASFYGSEIRVNRRIKPIILIIFGSILLTVIFMMAPQARGRLGQVSLFSDPKIRLETINMPSQEGPGKVLLARSFHNRPLVIAKAVLDEYANYFGTNFLTGNTALPSRYRIENFGLITYAELLLLALSLAAAGTKKEVWLLILLLLAAPLPAAITNEDTPNLHRALFMVPFLVLLETYGFIFILSLKKNARAATILIILALFFNWIYFAHFYFVHQKFGKASYFRNGGAKETAIKIYEMQDKYKKVLVTSSPDNLYPWFGFFNKIDPKSFEKSVNKKGNVIWTWKNVTFTDEKCPSEKIVLTVEKNSDKILIVDAEGCEIDPILAKKFNITKIKDLVRRPDLSEPYVFWEEK